MNRWRLGRIAGAEKTGRVGRALLHPAHDTVSAVVLAIASCALVRTTGVFPRYCYPGRETPCRLTKQERIVTFENMKICSYIKKKEPARDRH